MDTKELLILFGVGIAVFLAVFIGSVFLYTPTLHEFFKTFNTSNSFIVIENYTPEKSAVMQCGIELVGVSTYLGKNTNFLNFMVIEGGNCTYSKNFGTTNLNTTTATADECLRKAGDGVAIYLRYNPSQNSTRIYQRKMVIEGDLSFFRICPIYGALNAMK